MPCGFLLLQLIGQVLVQSVQALFPERAVLRDPVGGRAERLGVEAAVMDASFAAPLEEPGFFENLQVPRDGGQRDVERLRKIGHADLTEREASKDGAPGRICERGEGSVERGGIVNHQVNNIGGPLRLSSLAF
jgi:hypothetical protein